jgi:hypothetical protein
MEPGHYVQARYPNVVQTPGWQTIAQGSGPMTHHEAIETRASFQRGAAKSGHEVEYRIIRVEIVEPEEV